LRWPCVAKTVEKAFKPVFPLKRPIPIILLGAILACAAAFVLLTGQTLPSTVASHFAGDGHANGTMPRTPFIALMLAVSVGLPLVIATMQGFLLVVLPAMLSFMPNADYWFAPERYEGTYNFLRLHGLCFPAMLSMFLCFMHWQVVKANSLQPPALSVESVKPAIVLFVAGLLLWVGAAIFRFVQRR
jgi:uncharacterized membrane protein